MNILEKPIAAIEGRHRTTGDGVHMVARHARKGTRLDPHMHQESQLVYAATGTMQVTTPKGRWLVPPDRAVWVPARLGHAIDVLADIEMRTLYFDLAWLKREGHSKKLAKEFVVRVSPLLHQTILALFDDRNDPGAHRAAGASGDAGTGARRGFRDLHPGAAGAALPPRRRHRARRSHRRSRNRNAGARRSALRRGPCRGCLRPRRSFPSKAGASAPALPLRSSGCRSMPACR